MFEDGREFTVTALAAGLRAGEFTAVELAGAVIERSKRFARLAAIIAQDPQRMLEAARDADRRLVTGAASGPLTGVPLLVKDNIDTCDYPTSAGTPALERDVPREDATAVRRLRAAGAVIAGKANLHELAVGGTSYNRHFGYVRNPWDPDRIAGGSSGGSAAAVAARIVPAALGTDTNGSVRGPCAFSGIAGFRPGFRRYPDDGIMPPTPTRDSIGVIATTVDDLVVLDGVVSGETLDIPTIDPRELRLGRPRGDFYRVMDRRTAAVIDAAVDCLAAAGATIVDADIPDVAALTARAAWAISNFEVGRDLPAYLARRTTGITREQIQQEIASPVVRERFPRQAEVSDTARQRYEEAMRVHRPRLIERVEGYFADHRLDALLLPTVPFPAPPIAEDDNDLEVNGKTLRGGIAFMIQNTVYQSACGIPSLALPAGLADGLPIGICFDGPRGSDARILGIGRAFETLRGPFPSPV